MSKEKDGLSASRLVSIGIPVRNGEAFLGKALDSLINQDYPETELIISDNASTDRTGEICLDYSSRCPRIRYSRSEKPLEVADNFNRVLKLARGGYFMWAACDDTWESGFVTRLVRKLESNPDATAAFSLLDNIDGNDRRTREYPTIMNLGEGSPFKRLLKYALQKEELGKANLIYSLMRSEPLKQAGGYRTWNDAEWGTDMHVVFHILSLGQILIENEVLFHKRHLPAKRQPDHRTPFTRGFAGRIREFRGEFGRWHGYFQGYRRILKTLPGMPPGTKTIIGSAIVLREFWKLLASFFALARFPRIRPAYR